jgi:hypothetical protein
MKTKKRREKKRGQIIGKECFKNEEEYREALTAASWI